MIVVQVENMKKVGCLSYIITPLLKKWLNAGVKNNSEYW